MDDLEALSNDELLKEFLDAHQKYIDASANFHIYLPKTFEHKKAQQHLNKVVDEIKRRKREKTFFS